MKKVILSILIAFLLSNMFNVLAMNNNNNNNNNIQCPVLPDDMWIQIALKLINFNKIKEAKTLPELKKAVRDLVSFSIVTKTHNEIADYIANKKFEINGKKLKLNDFYIQRIVEILQAIKEALKNAFKEENFDWFNDINAQNKDGHTALIFATKNGSNYIKINSVLSDKELKEIVELLIQNGADINAKDNDGNTALMHAIMMGYPEIVELLIQNGANIEAKDKYGSTALMTAAERGRYEIVKLLIQSGANIHAKNDNGWTALIYASIHFAANINEHKNTVELLIQNGADMNIQDNIGYTILMYAACVGKGQSKEIVELLITNGADINAKDYHERTALMIALEMGHKEIAELLEKYKKE